MWKKFKRLSNGIKFAIVGLAFLALAGIIMLILALALHWDIIGGLTNPLAVVCYALVGVALTYIVAYYVKKKISGKD